MKLLVGKKALIFGVANKRSIAWAIAQTLHDQGAEIGISYGIPQLEKRVFPLAEELGVEFVEKCDVTSDEEIADLFAKAQAHFGKIDILVHSVAFAPSEELEGQFVRYITRWFWSGYGYQRLQPGCLDASRAAFDARWGQHYLHDLLWR